MIIRMDRPAPTAQRLARRMDRNVRRHARSSLRRSLGDFGIDLMQAGIAPAIPAEAVKVAARDALVQLNAAGIVYYSNATKTYLGSRVFAPGQTRCTPANLGAGSAGGECYTVPGVLAWGPSRFRANDSLVRAVVDEGQTFRTDEKVTVYYGHSPLASGGDAYKSGGYFQIHEVDRGDYVCSAEAFGPDPAAGKAKKCWIVPHAAPEIGPPITTYQRLAAEQDAQDRALAARQAQQDLYAAQIATQQANADAAAQMAQLARNAAAQTAAAQSSAEAYRAIQEQAQRQATELAAELARIAAANAGSIEAAEAAARVAAEAEAIRQATERARVDAARQGLANEMAQSAALVELQRQREAEAQLAQAQQGAAVQAELARQAAAGGVPGSGLDVGKLALFGGLAVGALFLISGLKKTA